MFSVIAIVLLPFMPESPTYLMSQSKEQEAIASLHWLRGNHYDINPELSAIRKNSEKQRGIKTVGLQELVSINIYLKPLLVVMVVMMLQQLSGINAVSFYIQIIFNQAKTGLSPCKLTKFPSERIL